MISGFDSPSIIAKINDIDIQNTEDFARNTLPDLIEEIDYETYYGIFKNKISKFKFLEGYKKQLYLIIEFYKKKCMEKSKKTPTKKNKNF